MGSFSNWSRHDARKHEKRFEIFVESNKSDLKQPSMSTFTIPLVTAKRKQTELEKSWENCSSVRISLWTWYDRNCSVIFVNWAYLVFFKMRHWSLSTELETNPLFTKRAGRSWWPKFNQLRNTDHHDWNELKGSWENDNWLPTTAESSCSWCNLDRVVLTLELIFKFFQRSLKLSGTFNQMTEDRAL